MSCVELSDAERATIDLVASENGGKVDWSDVRLNPIRGRIKQHSLDEQRHRCCYCQQRIRVGHGRAWDLEHVLNKKRYPDFIFEPENLAVACIDCNIAKGEEDVLENGVKIPPYPSSSESYLICHPHFDNYSDHIDLLNGCGYLPRTRKGVETIRVCDLTRFYERFDLQVDPSDELLVSIVDKCIKAESPDQRRVAVLEVAVLIDRFRSQI